MSRRDHMNERQLAWNDARRDMVDRIAARCQREGITNASAVVAAINLGLETEMKPLIEVELEVR